MPDGSVKHLRVLAHPVDDESGRLQFMGAVRDMTEAKQAQDRLHKAQVELAHVDRVATVGQLTASIGHEINQPLAAMVTNGEAGLRWVDRDPPRLDEVSDALKSMIESARRASEVVARIRALIKKTAPQSAPLAINSVIGDSVSLLRREMANHRVALRLELAPDLPAILGDRVQLQQVIINLMMNGMQAMAAIDDRARELIVRSRQDDAGQALVAVQDSGVGVDPKDEKATVRRLFHH